MEADPDELLAWLKGDGSGDRDLQIIALEQLCMLYYSFSKVFTFLMFLFLGMLVLMSDNIDRCFEQYVLTQSQFFFICIYFFL